MAKINVLSAGAVKPGLLKVVAAFQKDTRCEVTVSFATAPAIAERIGRGESFDIVIAPPQVLDKLTNSGQLPRAERIPIGRIGVGIMVRAGVLLPKIANVDELKQALREAESLVYNQASTGTYLDELFGRLGISAELDAKSTRYPDFSAVLDHVRNGKDREIGFGATTVIIENKINGVQFAGPLPEEIQNYTTYAAVAITGNNNESVQGFARYLASPPARDLLATAGID